MRVPTYANYMSMLGQINSTKANFDLYNFQAVTGLKAPNYGGYGMQAYSMVNLESTLNVTNNFLDTNKILGTEVKTTNLALDSISKSINEFKSMLTSFSGSDLGNITPDYTGGEITFGSDDMTAYEGKTLTVNGIKYTFNDGDGTGNNIDINGLTTGKEVADALKDKLTASQPNNMVDLQFDENGKFTFPLYTVNGDSSVLKVEGVKTGEPHVMNGDQYREMHEIQSMAFTTMKVLADSLNTMVNGKYVFGGGVSDKAPVNFPFKTLEEFQAYYDGMNIKYPTNSTSHLSNRVTTAGDTGNITLESQGGNKGVIKADKDGAFLKEAVSAGPETTGDLIFNSDKNQVKATQYGAFNTLNAGDTIVINNGDPETDGSYVIKSVSEDGKTITFEESTPIRTDKTLADGENAKISTSYAVGSVIEMQGFDNNVSSKVQVTGVSPDGKELYVTVDPSRWPAEGETQTIAASSKWSMSSEAYYKGGDLTTEKRVNENQSIVMDVLAKDPAFEKMFRALGNIAQGNFVDTRNPADGLDGTIDPQQTAKRVQEAVELVQDALFSGGKTAGQKNGDFYTIQNKINSQSIIINDAEENLKLVKKNLEDGVASVKNVNKEEAAVKALMASATLNASFSVLQNAMSVSLLNYMK